jgi:catechol 2,3-dioxygenase-like lactoylglutathione lyase family enzyme
LRRCAREVGKMAAQSLASGFTQVSYVVADLEVTGEWFKRALGVEFYGIRDIRMGGSGYKLTSGGKPITAEIKIKLALARAGSHGELEIELIQPAGGDSIYSRFVERTGGGIHHVAFETSDFDAAALPLLREGMVPHSTAGAGSNVAYFDCRPAGASIIEVAQFDREAWLDNKRLKYPPGTADSVIEAGVEADANAPRFSQISYTVRDAEAAMQWFQRALGVEYFGVTKAVAGRDYEVRVRDQPLSNPFALTTAMGRMGPRGEQEIEIIAPGPGDSPYREFLEQRGEGLNHIAFMVKDFEAAAERIRATGIKPLIEFRGHGIRACYFDCRAVGASIVEISHFDEKATAILERVKTPRPSL